MRRSSIAITGCSAARPLVSLCSQSLRCCAMRLCSARSFATAFFAIARALDLAADAALVAPQAPLLCGQRRERLDESSIREAREVGDAQIDAERRRDAGHRQHA